MPMRLRSSFVAVIAIPLLVCGCEEQQREHQLVSQVDSTPLSLDPTEHIELARWWSNGHEMLRLNDDASYSLYADQNRWHQPRERGRWSQENYFRAWLEPYNGRAAERVRIGIAKVDGKIVLTPPGLRPMLAIDRPPAVVEDRLAGAWSGGIGTLTLGDDGRYALAPAADKPASPIAKAGQSGAWTVAAGELVLRPDAPGNDPIRFPITADEKRLAITTPDGSLAKK